MSSDGAGSDCKLRRDRNRNRSKRRRGTRESDGQVRVRGSVYDSMVEAQHITVGSIGKRGLNKARLLLLQRNERLERRNSRL